MFVFVPVLPRLIGNQPVEKVIDAVILLKETGKGVVNFAKGGVCCQRVHIRESTFQFKKWERFVLQERGCKHHADSCFTACEKGGLKDLRRFGQDAGFVLNGIHHGVGLNRQAIGTNDHMEKGPIL